MRIPTIPVRALLAAALAVLTGLLMTAFGVFVYGEQPITFNVSAQSEYVRFITEKPTASRWVLQNAVLVRDYGDARETFSGYFQPTGSDEVVIERVANGPLYIHVGLAHGGGGSAAPSAGTFISQDERVLGAAGQTVEFFVTQIAERADSGSNVVIPISGQVEIGRELGLATWGGTGLLRSGRVRMLGRSIFGSRVFEAGGVDLDPGDQFRVEALRSPSLGFVLADERPGLTVAYRTIGRRGIVVRPGGGTYPVSASLFDRVLRDPLFVAISLFSGIFAVFAAMLGSVRKWRDRNRRPRAPCDGWRPSSTDAPAEVDGGTVVVMGAAAVAIGAGILLALLGPSAATAQSSVFVRGGAEGQGLLRRRLNTCYVVVPGHVVINSVGDIEVIGLNGLRGTAVPEQTFEADVAVLRMKDGGDLSCMPWLSASPEHVLSGEQGGYLRTIEKTGSETRLPVVIRKVGTDYITVRPRDSGDRIGATMSGAPLVVSGVVTGILQLVCEEGAEGCVGGDGLVYRIDALFRLTDGFFGNVAIQGESMNLTEAQVDSITGEARYDSLVAQSNRSVDTIRMAARNGRLPDLPTFKRDLDRVELFSSAGFMDCVFECLSRSLSEPFERPEGRVLYAIIRLSQPVLTSAPNLPDEVGQCTLFSTGGPVRTFSVPHREQANGGWTLAWGGTAATLPPGEYWLQCVVDGLEFESAHLNRLRPTRPFGEVDFGENRLGLIRMVHVVTPGGGGASWRVDPDDPRPRVVLPVPRRPDVAITISFDVAQIAGAPVEEMTKSYCQVHSLSRNGDARIEVVRVGVWRISQEVITGGERWRAGEYSASCGPTDVSQHYFDFKLILQ